jgi:hypothetical protein
MTILGINFSIKGLEFAILFLILAVFIFSFETDGQGGVLELFVTFPWFFLSLNNKIPYHTQYRFFLLYWKRIRMADKKNFQLVM